MRKKITRREAMKTSLLFGAGVLVVTNGILAKGNSPNEKLSVACIGVGGQGQFQLDELAKLKDVQFVALCDVDDTRAGDAYTRFPKARKFYDYREMFDSMEKSIDAVTVSTPDHTHFHPVMRAISAGKHVYCEKPLAHSVWECRTITEAAAKMKVATQLGCQRHAFSNVHRVVELIQSGVIGQVEEVYTWIGGERGMPAMPTRPVTSPETLHWDLWLGPCSTDWQYCVTEDSSGKTMPTFAPYNWRFWWDFGTGETGNWACHNLDIPYWALELKYPVHVSASGPPVDRLRTPKSMMIEYVFPARDSQPPVRLYFSHAPTPVCKEIFGLKDVYKDNAGKDFPLTSGNNLFVGTEGMILTRFDRHVLLPEKRFEGFEYPKRFIPDSPGFHREWVDACKGGQAATCRFEYSGPMSESALLGNTAFRAGHRSFDWNGAAMMAADCLEVQSLLKPTFREGWK